MQFLLALDQGTTSSRAIVYDEALTVRGLGQRAFPQYFPSPGWVEHDPMEIWQSQTAAVQEALVHAGVRAADIAGVGITNQRETVVAWNKRTGHPLTRALVWQDRRTAATCQSLRAAGHEPEVQTKTGLLLDPYFSASKIAWLLEHDAEVKAARARHELAVGTVDSWLAYRLSAGHLHLTDASNASRTLLYNLASGDWDEDLLRLFGIPREILPRIVDSSGHLGELTELGLRAPLAGLAGDQQAALFGQRCVAAGDAKCTYGTGCFLLQHTGQTIVRSQARLLSTVAWSRDGEREFALEGSVFMGGATVQWLRDGLGIIAHAADIEPLAREVPDSGGVVLVPAFTGLGAPYWDADARGLLIGLTRGTTKAHIARATLDAIAWQVADVIEAMQADTSLALSSLKVDGGACRNELLMQRQADVLNCTIVRPPELESTVRGAAMLAGYGLGWWPGMSATAPISSDASTFLPNAMPHELAAERARWRAAVTRARGWSAADA